MAYPAMNGLWKQLAYWFKLRQFAERDARNAGLPDPKDWPRCADGSRIHDMKGQPVCPACGWRPALAKGPRL